MQGPFINIQNLRVNSINDLRMDSALHFSSPNVPTEVK